MKIICVFLILFVEVANADFKEWIKEKTEQGEGYVELYPVRYISEHGEAGLKEMLEYPAERSIDYGFFLEQFEDIIASKTINYKVVIRMPLSRDNEDAKLIIFSYDIFKGGKTHNRKRCFLRRKKDFPIKLSVSERLAKGDLVKEYSLMMKIGCRVWMGI